MVWDAVQQVLGAPGGRDRRHRRRHRRVRGPARRAGPPGHRRRPQPRRARRAGAVAPPRAASPTGHRPPGRPGRPARPGRRPAAPTWCSATACSRSSTTRPRRWPRSRGVLRPGGTLSLLVAQRHAAVVARAMAGHFAQARAAARRPGRRRRSAGGRRFTADEVTGAARRRPASTPQACTRVRVFADLVPGSLLDLEPGAAAGPGRARARGRRPPRVPPPRHPAARCSPTAAEPAAGRRRWASRPGEAPVSDGAPPDCPILHVDMDAFYASVAIRDRPDLAATSRSIVGGGHRGVVLSANYLARALRRPLGDADDPGPAAVPARGGGRARTSRPSSAVSPSVMETFRQVTPLVEVLSLDEAFLDVSGSVRRLGVAVRHRRAAARPDLRRAGHHLLGRDGRHGRGRQAGQPARQARRHGRGAAVGGDLLPAPARRRRAVGGGGEDHASCCTGSAWSPSATSRTPR